MTTLSLNNTADGIFVSSPRRQLHLAFWGLTTLLYFGHVGIMGWDMPRMALLKFFFLPFQLIAAYVLIFVLLEKWLYKGKYLLAGLGFFVFVYLLCVAANIPHDYWLRPMTETNYNPPTFIHILTYAKGLIVYYFVWIFFLPLILSCLDVILLQYRNFSKIEALESEKRIAELNLLKTKIHPAFLLSTLRNLESLCQQSAPEAPVVIEKLSNTLDYILYRGPQQSIEIGRELEAIEEYIDLEKIRLQDELSIELEIDIPQRDWQIAPLVLFSFLEHNFKGNNRHGISHSRITLAEKKSNLIASIHNKLKPNTGNEFYYDRGSMQQQLSISYPGQHKLEITRGAKELILNLTISL